MKKNLALAVLVCLSLAPLPAQAQNAKQHPMSSGPINYSCKGSGVNLECPAYLLETMSRQSGTLVCQYNSRLRVWQLMQGRKPKKATKPISEVPASHGPSSGMAAGREVLFQSESQSECETTGEALASQLSQNGNVKWDTKTTEIKN